MKWNIENIIMIVIKNLEILALNNPPGVELPLTK